MNSLKKREKILLAPIKTPAFPAIPLKQKSRLNPIIDAPKPPELDKRFRLDPLVLRREKIARAAEKRREEYMNKVKVDYYFDFAIRRFSFFSLRSVRFSFCSFFSDHGIDLGLYTLGCVFAFFICRCCSLCLSLYSISSTWIRNIYVNFVLLKVYFQLFQFGHLWESRNTHRFGYCSKVEIFDLENVTCLVLFVCSYKTDKCFDALMLISFYLVINISVSNNHIFDLHQYIACRNTTFVGILFCR